MCVNFNDILFVICHSYIVSILTYQAHLLFKNLHFKSPYTHKIKIGDV